MKSIDILLATYNGSDYLENQILSVIGQTYKNWKLIIHDDGSKDSTLEVIKKYQDIDNRIFLVKDDLVFNDAAANFMHLLKLSTSELIIFCDQDDIWFENKLILLVNGFDNKFEEPMAVFCNGFAYRGDEGIINDKITNVFPKELKEQLFLNGGIQGCSLMFNLALKQKLNVVPQFIAMHDHFITLGAICFGQLKYIDKSLMLYRQFHANKVTANIEFSLIKRFKSEIPVIDRTHYKATESFYQTYKSQLTPGQIQLFEAYLLYPESTLWKRISVVIKNRFKIYNSTLALLLKTITRKPIN
ncbi:glycosyltransferase [Pedobacter cryoconitis]|uniref:glycosyltransferase n=1 Tax=Pedobacter cryoconitis TaxID=188932 RepID=UPI00160E3FA3|nr:glycosyltransferase [Pedobacter cryoconitis]MBB5647476.1 rhamnosyltransferase [Pedobacter cryoconitis]